MAEAMVNPEMLRWFRMRAGVSLGALAGKLQLPEERLMAWESGETRPTFRQAQQFAQQVHVPFGYLFLREPPEDELPVPDLRTVGDHAPRSFSVDLKDVVRDVVLSQLWYRDYQQAMEAAPVAVVGRATLSMPVIEIVTDMQRWLGLAGEARRGSWDQWPAPAARCLSADRSAAS